MDLQVAEAAREGHVLVRVHRLVPEEDDLVVVQRLAQLGHDVVGQGAVRSTPEISAPTVAPSRRASKWRHRSAARRSRSAATWVNGPTAMV